MPLGKDLKQKLKHVDWKLKLPKSHVNLSIMFDSQCYCKPSLSFLLPISPGKGKAQRERQAAQKTTALHDSTSQLEEEMFHINRQVPQGAEKSIAAYTASAANVDKKMKQALRDFKETEKMLIRAKADRKVAQLAGLRSEIDALEDDYEVGARALELPDAPTPSPTKQAKDTTTDAVTETSKPEMSGTTDVKSAPVVEAPKPTSEISRVRGGIARRKLRAKERAQEQTPGSPGNVM